MGGGGRREGGWRRVGGWVVGGWGRGEEGERQGERVISLYTIFASLSFSYFKL